jgi:hypothetical protein
MITKANIAAAAVLILGTASAATAAPKHPVHRHQTAVVRQVPAAAYGSFGSALGTGRVQEPLYMRIQDQDFKNQLGG